MINTKYIYTSLYFYYVNLIYVIKFIYYWVGRLSLSLTESLLSVDSFLFVRL
jgi:hypothetical protein